VAKVSKIAVSKTIPAASMALMYTIFNKHFNPGRFLVSARYTFCPGIKAT